MTKPTKILLTISLMAFAIGCTDVLWGLGKPLGAVFFGLFLISKVLEKEVALFNEEEQLRFTLAQQNTTAARKAPRAERKSSPTAQPGLGARC
jgi:hypothetical protein